MMKQNSPIFPRSILEIAGIVANLTQIRFAGGDRAFPRRPERLQYSADATIAFFHGFTGMKSSRQRFAEFREKIRKGLLDPQRYSDPNQKSHIPMGGGAGGHHAGPAPGKHVFKRKKKQLFSEYREMLTGVCKANVVAFGAITEAGPDNCDDGNTTRTGGLGGLRLRLEIAERHSVPARTFHSFPIANDDVGIAKCDSDNDDSNIRDSDLIRLGQTTSESAD